jgi:hypothetical protein
MARKPNVPAPAVNPPTEPSKPKSAVDAMGVSESKPKRPFGGFTKRQWIYVGVMAVIGLWGLNLNAPSKPLIIPTSTPGITTLRFDAPSPTAIEVTSTVPSVVVQVSTVAPTATITETPAPLPTDTPVPPTVAALVVQAVQPSATFIIVENDGLGDVMVFNPVKMFYAGANGAKLRSCPNRTCEVVASLLVGDQLIANGAIDGEEVEQGNKLWYRTQVNGQTLYAFSGILDSSAPSSAGGSASGGSSSSPTMSQPVLSGGACPNISATCGQLNSCDEARACYAAGNTSLDGNDKDGIPCESLCGG